MNDMIMLTEEHIELFSDHLLRQERTRSTIAQYRRSLQSLSRFLNPDKILDMLRKMIITTREITVIPTTRIPTRSSPDSFLFITVLFFPSVLHANRSGLDILGNGRNERLVTQTVVQLFLGLGNLLGVLDHVDGSTGK